MIPILIFLKLVIKINSDDVMVGTGLRRMKAYTCKISMDDLIKKRAEFWGK